MTATSAAPLASSDRASAGARIRGSSPARRATPPTSRCPGMVHAAILRSPHAHARIRSIDTSRAKTGARRRRRVHRRRHRGGASSRFRARGWCRMPDLKIAPYRALATDVVRYVGDAVAVVVAESDYQAYDALELIDVDYEPLPAVVDPQKAAAAGRAAAASPRRPATSRSTGPSRAATSTPRSRRPTSSSAIASSSSG